ncbi:MAG: hypothetical protein JXR84_15160 [Anaerolineae bacterium]|nr:hypothetical protein [Anaerolineae bacterium]
MASKVKLSIVLTDDQIAAIDAQADLEQRSRSSMLRRLVDIGMRAIEREAKPSLTDVLVGSQRYAPEVK